MKDDDGTGVVVEPFLVLDNGEVGVAGVAGVVGVSLLEPTVEPFILFIPFSDNLLAADRNEPAFIIVGP